MAGRSYISFKTVEDDYGGGVICITAEKEPWATVAPDQTIKLRGKWPAVAFGLELADCVVVEAGPSTAVKISAEALAKEFAGDPDATASTHNFRHWLIVDGEVIEQKEDADGIVTLILKGRPVPSDCPRTVALRRPAPWVNRA